MVDGRIVGFEALVRWNHPEMGLIPPIKFISLAEETGLIIPIGEWILHTACQQAKQWHDAGLNPGLMAVNISGVQIEHYDLVDVVAQILNEVGLAAGSLELELTESSIMQSPERAVSQLERLKSMGVMLAIDDFGTGYSSLSHLLKFPFDKLKIDRSFVISITTKANDAVLARSIIAMAQGMRLRVIAEGVETEEQLYYLKRNGCDELQGYLFSQPLDSEGARNLLIENRQLTFSAESVEESQLTILIVDDEENILRSLNRLLRPEGYQILTTSSASEALQLMARYNVQVILSDMRMPEINGTELLKQIRDLYPDTVRMILSGYSDITAVTEAVNSGGLYKFMLKPWDDDELKRQIKDAFKAYRSNRHSLSHQD
jgi:EAL domain-containing protein (putative c-di-GMP-specific phosphodiesterase class I)/CheY-like chemotaxis protein